MLLYKYFSSELIQKKKHNILTKLSLFRKWYRNKINVSLAAHLIYDLYNQLYILSHTVVLCIPTGGCLAQMTVK